MYYEINVSLNGQHFFATDKRSVQTQGQLHRVYAEIIRAFPADRGFEIGVTRWESRGTPVNVVLPPTMDLRTNPGDAVHGKV